MNLNPSRALAIAAGLVIIALTAAAFWLSYAHLAEVALAHGMRDKEVRAWAWPATLDLFIVAGELLMLRAALAGKVDAWAIGLTVAGSGGSIALNVAGVGSHAELLDYVVAAVPPTAALLAFGALMRQIHQALAERADRSDIDTVATPRDGAADLRSADGNAGVSETDATEAQRATVAEERPELPPATRPPVVPDGVRLLPLVRRPDPVEVTTTEAPRQFMLDHFAERYVPYEKPEKVVIPKLDDADPWAQGVPFQTTIGRPPSTTNVLPAETPRQMVTEPIVRTPADLRREARRLHREAVRSTSRPVTIQTLQTELSLSRRDATELRREVVEGGRS